MKLIAKKAAALGMSLLCASTILVSTPLTSNAEDANSDFISNNAIDTSQLSPEELFNYYMEVGEVPPVYDEEDAISTTVIIDTDERTKVENTNVAPYKYIGKLYVNGGNSTCAGFAKNAVLTAAHCVYNGETNQLKEFQKIEFGLNNDTSCKVITTQPTEIIVCQDYINGDHTSKSDWAIIYFEDNILRGYLGFSTGLSSGAQITVTGYPGKGSAGDNTGKEQYTCSGNVLDFNTQYFKYDADTTGGQSGSPVYNSKNYIVGVHHGGSSSQGGNYAARVKGELYTTMNAIRTGTYTPST